MIAFWKSLKNNNKINNKNVKSNQKCLNYLKY